MVNILTLGNYGIAAFVLPGPPDASVLGAQLNDVYCDADDGRLFNCTNETFGAQTWMGTDGIEYGSISIIDPAHPNLIAMYTMDNISGATLVDESPNNNDGTISGAIAVPGHIGDALLFDGINDTLELGNIYSPSQGSISTWFVGDGDTTRKGSYSRSDGSQNLYMSTFWDASGSFAIDVIIVGNEVNVLTNATFNFSNTHHVVFVSTGSEYKIYVNGVSEALNFSGTGSNDGDWANLFTAGYSDSIGNLKIATHRFYDVTIDQTRLFDIGVVQSEVDELYNGGAGA